MLAFHSVPDQTFHNLVVLYIVNKLDIFGINAEINFYMSVKLSSLLELPPSKKGLGDIETCGSGFVQ